MAYYSGAQVNAAGSLIGILDTELVKNANWTIYDDSVGANNKTYKCGVTGGECYLNVADNQTNYATVNLWEGWDAVGHAGTGASTGSWITIYWRKTTGNYMIHLEDERVIYSCFGTNLNYSHFAGNVERFSPAYNTPILVGQRSTSTTSNNPLGHGGTTSGIGWAGIFVGRSHAFNACCSYFDLPGPAAGSYLIWKEKNLGRYIQENLVANSGYSKLIGIMRGVQSLGASNYLMHGISHGDTVTIGGDTWDCHGGNQLALIKRA